MDRDALCRQFEVADLLPRKVHLREGTTLLSEQFE